MSVHVSALRRVIHAHDPAPRSWARVPVCAALLLACLGSTAASVARAERACVSFYVDRAVRQYDSNGVLQQGYTTAVGMAGVAFAPNGDLYVSTGGNASILKISAGVVSTFMASAPGFPFGMAFRSDGRLYVAESANNVLRRYDGPGAGSTGFDSSGLQGPAAVAFDYADNLYVANQGDGSTRRFGAYGTDLGAFVPSGLASPTGLAFDAAGNLFVTCQGSNTVAKVDPQGNVSVFTGASLNGPVGLAFDVAGDLYVANQRAGTVVKFDANGAPTPFVPPSGQPLFIPLTDDSGVPLPVPPGHGLSCGAPSSGVVSWWPAEGDAQDVVDGNDGTLRFGATVAPGIIGQAFKLDGTRAHVSVPSSASLNPGTGDFTVCAWARTSYRGGVGNEIVMSKTSTGSHTQFSLGYRAPLSSTGFPQFTVGNGSGGGRRLEHPRSPTGTGTSSRACATEWISICMWTGSSSDRMPRPPCST